VHLVFLQHQINYFVQKLNIYKLLFGGIYDLKYFYAAEMMIYLV